MNSLFILIGSLILLSSGTLKFIPFYFFPMGNLLCSVLSLSSVIITVVLLYLGITENKNIGFDGKEKTQ